VCSPFNHALSSSEIYVAVAKRLEIIGHLTNCCKRPIWVNRTLFEHIRENMKVQDDWTKAMIV